jgi:hypothetical protein
MRAFVASMIFLIFLFVVISSVYGTFQFFTNPSKQEVIEIQRAEILDLKEQNRRLRKINKFVPILEQMFSGKVQELEMDALLEQSKRVREMLDSRKKGGK